MVGTGLAGVGIICRVPHNVSLGLLCSSRFARRNSVMKIDLNGKTAIVTGSSAGIGWGCARGLAGAGATGVVTARRQDAWESARDRLIDAVPGSTVRALAADFSKVGGFGNLGRAEPPGGILGNNL